MNLSDEQLEQLFVDVSEMALDIDNGVIYGDPNPIASAVWETYDDIGICDDHEDDWECPHD